MEKKATNKKKGKKHKKAKRRKEIKKKNYICCRYNYIYDLQKIILKMLNCDFFYFLMVSFFSALIVYVVCPTGPFQKKVNQMGHVHFYQYQYGKKTRTRPSFGFCCFFGDLDLKPPKKKCHGLRLDTANEKIKGGKGGERK